jgi:alanyl-tRNA synthetase
LLSNVDLGELVHPEPLSEMSELLVTYPGGSTSELTAVAAVTRTAESLLFAVERTPCHPEGGRWPDQPADRCTLEIAGTRVPIECHEGYLRQGELGIGAPPEASAEEGPVAHACVVHRASLGAPVEVGAEVTLRVDEHRRELLSRSHTRCHLVSLALNAALAGAWRKQVPVQDSLGHPDFDRLAIQSSRIELERSVDIYRIGRHVRKAGLSAEALSDTDALAARVSSDASRWLQSRS